MKFEVQKSVLLDALQLAVATTPSKSTLQILYNLLFTLEGNQLEIRATDLDLAIALRLEVEGHQNGSVVVNARKILEVVKELPDLPVFIASDDFVVTIKSESGFQGNLTGFDPSEYPAFPDTDNAQSFDVALKDLRLLADKTLFAASTDFSRMALTGTYLEARNGFLELVATDGHRLGKAKVPFEGPSMQPGAILPPKSLAQVLRMAEDPEERITVMMNASHARFYTATITLVTKLIDGPYPNYENVIPRDFQRQAVINREHLASVVRRVVTMANLKTRLTVFQFDGGQVTLSARNQDLGGDSEESMPCRFEGEAVEIGVNGAYLLEELAKCQSEEVRLKFNGALGAIIVEPVVENPAYFFIVMPLRILRDPA